MEIQKAEPVSVIIRSRSDLDKQSDSKIMIVGFSKTSRIMRAVKSLAVCWAISIFCILVPMLHFILVPAFFILGIFMFFHQMSIHCYLISGTIGCPSCRKDLNLRPAAFDWPKREICQYCRADLSVEKFS